MLSGPSTSQRQVGSMKSDLMLFIAESSGKVKAGAAVTAVTGLETGSGERPAHPSPFRPEVGYEPEQDCVLVLEDTGDGAALEEGTVGPVPAIFQTG